MGGEKEQKTPGRMKTAWDKWKVKSRLGVPEVPWFGYEKKVFDPNTLDLNPNELSLEERKAASRAYRKGLRNK